MYECDLNYTCRQLDDGKREHSESAICIAQRLECLNNHLDETFAGWQKIELLATHQWEQKCPSGLPNSVNPAFAF